MALTLKTVLKLMRQGQLARRRGTTRNRYPAKSSEHRWWAKGWLEQDAKR